MGLVMGLTLASQNTNMSILHTDHLNSVQLIKNLQTKIAQDTKLHSLNGRSYYRWIANILQCTHTSVIHVKSHTNDQDIASLLNNEANHYASIAQNATHLLPVAPIPMFYMDQYTYYCETDSWIESNIRTFVNYFISRQTLTGLSSRNNY
jgi:hypothetical protein